MKIEGDDIRFFLPTFVAPRYHPYTERDPVPSSTVKRIADGLSINLSATMSHAITSIVSPSHPVVFVLRGRFFHKPLIVFLAE